MLEYLQRLAWDPSAPAPPGWPRGWWGALLLFCIPGGAGIPSGVLLGHHDGLDPVVLTGLYFLSDLILACLFEPLLAGLVLVAGSVPRLARAGRAVMAAVERTTAAGGVSAPVGVVLTGFGAGLPFGRALAATAGQRLVPGWLLTIGGDMLYFLLGMTSTLWLDGMLGDQRATVLVALVVMMLVPALVRRWRTATG